MITEHMKAKRDSALSFAQAMTMTKQQAISAAILIVQSECSCTLEDAMDCVLGEGTFKQIANDVYEALQ